MVILYPTVIQPFFNKLSPLAEGDLRNRIENLATKLKFPLKHLYEIDGSKRSSHSNAYFFGLPWVNGFLSSGILCDTNFGTEQTYCHIRYAYQGEQSRRSRGRPWYVIVAHKIDVTLTSHQPTNLDTGTIFTRPSSFAYLSSISSPSLHFSPPSYTRLLSCVHSISLRASPPVLQP